jgi:hypothetical protein
VTDLVSIVFNPVLVTHAFTMRHLDLREAGHLYVQIVNKLNPASRLKIVDMAQRLITEERRSPSQCSAQLRSRVHSVVASDNGKGSIANPIDDGGSITIEQLAFLVLMTAANSQDQDLSLIMSEVQAMTAAKQFLRQLMNIVDTDIASNAATQTYPTGVARFTWSRKP